MGRHVQVGAKNTETVPNSIGLKTSRLRPCSANHWTATTFILPLDIHKLS